MRFYVSVMFKYSRPIFIIIFSALFFLSAFFLLSTNVFADDSAKKPVVDAPYNVVVIGDSLAVGLWQGLHKNLQNTQKPAFNVVREAKVNTGLVRSDRFDWPRHVEKLAKRSDFQAAVIMFGGNDAQSIRTTGKRYHYKTPGWEEHYRQRIDRVITAFKKKDVVLYWVGLPNIKKSERREDYLHVNAIFKERAEANGVRFIDTWDVTNDENGHFRPHGKTIDGKKALLRAKDGIHFTPEGYRILARYPQKALLEDMIALDEVTTSDILKKVAH